jgi:2-polyprenyl-3-methyl-5-hydroxy-6-metoxy-1,4-benzoquinol methylase
VRYNGAVPVCIAGMHRSGTSVVARVLSDCGLYLGSEDELTKPDANNREGSWENFCFVELNDELLAAFDGRWDQPPQLPMGWEERPEVEPLRDRAVELIRRFETHEPWGWKDPRNTLTLPFWRRLIPGMSVVACVRDPREVALSLVDRGFSSEADALDLWLGYYQRLVDTIPFDELTVVQFDALFERPAEEVRRLAQALGFAPSETQVARATARVNELVRHSYTPDGRGEHDRLPVAIAECYEKLQTATHTDFGSRQAPHHPEARGGTVEEGAPPELPYTTLDDSPDSAHTLVMDLVPHEAKVLDVGCATGYMARALVDNRSCRVTGIEISEEAGKQARRHCDRVIIGDIETMDLDEELGEERFDAIIFADVLEHLRYPAQVLLRVRTFLSENGAILASIPNVAHGSVRLALLAGEFRYRPLGLLDKTHLRFFTREGVQDLFEESGYAVTTWRRRRLDLADAEIRVPPSVPNEARVALAGDPEASTYQFIVRATPSDAASQLRALHEALRTARDLEALMPTEEELALVREELATLQRAHEGLQRRFVAAGTAFSDHAHELRELISPLRDELSWRSHAMESQTEEIEWRKGVMEKQETQLAALQSSRLFRYSAPVRKVLRRIRPRR